MEHFSAIKSLAGSLVVISIVAIGTDTAALAQAPAETRITLAMREAELGEVMEMLSRQNRTNILLADNVEATVSFNLYDVALDEAIRSIADAAGYVVEKRQDTYFILPTQEAGKTPGSGFTVVRSFPVDYADVDDLENKLSDYLSEFGSLTAVPERKLLIVEDQPPFVNRIAALVADLNVPPQQVMIEARILEVSLSDEESYGIDWSAFFDGNQGTIGTQGLSEPGTAGNTGFFFDYLTQDYEIAIRALETDGRVRNLASPKLVTVEGEESEVIIGDRRGYRVTTTINQVTSETIEFLESGVILRVTPSVDEDGLIALIIHPEVSNGIVDENGIPSQTTTEVTTELVVSSGQSIFIGGLLRSTSTESRQGIPILGRIPGLRWLFSNRTRTSVNVETVVLITPRLLDAQFARFSADQAMEYEATERELADRSDVVEQHVESAFGAATPNSTETLEE